MSISVSPNATLLAGSSQQMVAVGYDADGRVMNIEPAWSVAAGGGVIASSGVFTAGSATGLFANTVVASVRTVSGRASITVVAGALATITVVPTPVTLAVAATQQFTAVGRDASGNIVAFSPTWAVVASGGTIDQTGMFTAGGTPGTFTNTVQASYNNIKGFATVNVTAGPLASITVTPNPATLPVGQSQQFTAVGKDASGNVLTMTPVWTVVAGGGTINATGLFVAGGTLGTFANTVKATSGTASGTATVTVTLGAAATITISPNPATMAIGASAQLTAVGKDAAGNVVAITPVWDVVTPGNGASLTQTGLYTAGTVAGTFPNKVRATSGGVSGYGTIIATSAVLTSITVSPNPVFLQTGDMQQFTAVGRDANNNVFLITPTWSVVNSGGAINSSTGVFTAGLVAGAFSNTVVATSGTISGAATVNVAAALAQIVVSPSPVSVVVSGTQQFSAVGRDAGGNVFSISPVWSVVSGGGTISTAGLFTAGLVTGTYANTVKATSGSFSGTATVTVTATPPALATITVVPNSVTMLVNGTQQFEAMGWDALGNIFPLAPVWTVVNGGGSINSPNGLFTAGTVAGTFSGTVKATSGTISGTATVIITDAPPLLATITVTPSPDTLSVGGGRQFTAVGKDAGGNVIAFTPTWSVVAGGGAISGTGFFTAGAVTGTFTNTVVVSSGSISGFVTVVVLPLPQTITFVPPATPAAYGSSFAIAPTASSGLPVTVTPSGGCLLSGATVTMTSGTIDCVLTASQAGNGSYTAASNVVQTVMAAKRAASVTPNAAGKAFAAAEPSPLTTGTLIGFLAGDNVVASYSRVAGEAVGTYAISATLTPVGVLPNYAITYNTALFTIGQVAQTITFAAPVTPATYGSTFAIAPTASSGLTVTVTPSGGCSLAGLTVTMTSGTTACVLTASQAGNGSFTAATNVVRTVAAATLAASVTPTAAGKAFGAADPTPLTTGTLTGFLAGDNVVAAYGRVAGEAVGTYAISATLTPVGVLPNYSITYNTALFTIGQVAQTITFAAPVTPATYGSTFAIAPTASSGLPVTVTPSGGCSLAGLTVTMTSGTTACVLTASQAGNASFTAATNVVQTVAAATRAASVTPTAAGKAFGAADPIPLTTGTLTGFLAGDNVVAAYSRVVGEGVGTYAISATLTPVGVLPNYAITYNTALFTIGQVAQTITFAAPVTPATYGSTFVIAPTATSGLTVTVTPSGGCTLSGSTVTMTSGTTACVLTASQAGNGSFTAATNVVQTVAAATRAASVTPNAASKAFGAADPIPLTTGTLTGFLAGDNVVASYSRVAGEAVGTYAISATLTPVGVLPNYSITYNTALFTIGQVAQTITFAAPVTPATYGSTFAIAPTASSGLTVTVTPSGGCSIAAGTVTMTSGTAACVLTASQAGNASFTAATNVVQTVAAATRAASVTPTAAGKAFGAADPIPLTTGTLTGFLAGDNVIASYSRVAGEAVGSYAISATLTPVGVLPNYSITYNTALFTIGQVAQTITFAAPVTPAAYGSTFTVSPTASSGLAVTVTPSGGCSIAGGTVTMTSGTTACVLTASQAGNGSFTAATNVAHTVAAALLAASVTPTAAGKAFGAADPSPLTTGTLTGFLAGDNVIASYSRIAGEAVGTYAISATLTPVGVLPNYAITYNTALFTIGQVAQTISFAAPVTPAVYGSTFSVFPTASSGLAVTVTPSGGCTLSGSTVTMTSGTTACVLTASQAGNGSFTAATNVVRTVAAATLAASVTPTAAGKAFGAADPGPLTTGTLVGFLAGDNVVASYSRVAGEAVGTYTISATLTPVGVLGNYAITYNTALFTVGQAAQAIVTLSVPASGTVGQAGLTAVASGGSGTGAYSYTSSTSGVCTVNAVSGSITALTVGTCSLTATRAADANYLVSAASAVGSFPITTVAQTITFAQPTTPAVYGSTFVVAPTASSGLTVTVTPSGGCSIAGGTVTMTSGTTACTLTASQTGDATYAAAPDVVRIVAASPVAQAIVTLSVPASGTVGQAGLTAVAGGGSGTGAYSYASSTSGVCTVNAANGSIAALAAGTCSLTATRAADANYLVSAASAMGSFPITTVAQTITFAQPATPAVYGSTFVVAPTASSGLTVTVTPSGGCSIAGGTVTMTSSTVACVLTASQAGNATYAAAPDVVRTVAASAATQAVVTLTLPGSATVGQAGLTAVAGGGSGTGAYSYASSTTGVCTVVAATGSITAVTVGTCTLTATRAADANYLVSATSAPQSFPIGFGAAASFAVLGGSGAASTCTSGTIAGNVGMSPGTVISGFGPCVIVAPGDGTLHLNDAAAIAAQADVTTVNTALAGMAYTTDLSGQDLGTKNLAPGVYYFSSSAQLTGTLTLTGSATDVWVFKIGSDLTTAGGASVSLAGANAGNVYWQVGTSATLGGNNSFKGNIIAAASITIGTGTDLIGRALAKVNVTLHANTITLP